MLEKLGDMLIDLVKYALTGLFIFLPIRGWLGGSYLIQALVTCGQRLIDK
jgi:hypothetical protein